jgi:hypothetical protein
MNAIATAPGVVRTSRDERLSWPRLLWVAPLTLIVAVAVCFGLRTAFEALDPTLSQMAQLGPPMVTQAVEGTLAAIVVFVLFALLVPRAIFWYRIVGGVALLLSWIPDIALGIGGTPMRLALRYVGPLASLTLPGVSGGGPPPGGPPPGAQTGGPPPGFLSSMSIEQVLVLMVLHAAVGVTCILMLTTLTRARLIRQSRSA